MKYRLIYDKEAQETIDDKVLPLVEELIDKAEIFDPELIDGFDPDQKLLFYVSDEQLKSVFSVILEKELTVTVLPHPENKESCIGFGVSRQLDKAVKHLKTAPGSLKADVFYCNDKIVFDQVSVGENFMTTGDLSAVNKLFGLNFRQLKRLFTIKLFLLDVKLSSDKNLKTAVSSISISEHRKSSLLSRMMMDDSSLSDKKLHLFLLSPRSLMEMIRYMFSSLKSKNKLPGFAAHIKTKGGELSFPEGERVYVVDKKLYKASSLKIYIGEKAVNIVPGEHLNIPEKPTASDEIFKTSALPDQATAKEITGKTLPLIRHASTEEFKGLFLVLRDNASLKSSYLVLMVLSTLLATFGLFANSSPVVIGAMILAPLMSPIISLSMGALRQDKKLILTSIYTILSGLGIALAFAVLLTWLTPINTAGEEILSRTRPNLLDLGIAVVSGIAGAYAHARTEIAKTLAGVAIAVALIPPLAVAAIGLGWLDFEIFFGAILLLVTNLAGMIFAASVTFLLLGFSPLKLATKGMLISLVVVALLSIPLALSFGEMVRVHRITAEMKTFNTDIFDVKDIQVQHTKPLKIALKIVSEEPLDVDQLDSLKQRIEKKLEREVELEFIFGIKR